ncbi:hypothetical protein ACTXT7_016502 [Hymenolepis weldensis]
MLAQSRKQQTLNEKAQSACHYQPGSHAIFFATQNLRLFSDSVQVAFSSMTTCNRSELSYLSILLSVRLSSFRLKSSFLELPAENHLLQVFSFTTSFAQVSLSVFAGAAAAAAELGVFP